MTQTGLIIRRFANTFIPNEYAELAVKAYPHGWGAAIVDGELKTNKSTSGLTLDFLQSTLGTFPDKDITLHLCNATNFATNEDDLSPFEFVESQIVGFIAGNFPAFTKPESSHPQEFFLAHEVLIPKFQGLWEMADGNLAKVVEQLKKPHFKREMLLNSVGHGTIVLVCADGSIIPFSQGDTSMEYPWGWVSDNLGYAAGVAKREEPKEEESASMFPSKKKSASTVREKAPAATPAKVDTQAKAEEKLGDAVKAPQYDASIIKNYTVKKMTPGPNMSRSEKSDWYKNKIGYRPPCWEKNVAINCFFDPHNKLMTWSEVKGMGAAAIGLVQMAQNPRAKDTEPEHVQPEKALGPPPGSNSGSILPIMDGPTRDYIKAKMALPEVKKIIAENADIIEDPATVQGIEAKFASFNKQLGANDMKEFERWSYEMMYDLAKERPQGISVMAFEFRNEIARLSQKLKKALGERAEKQETTHELAKDELKPEKESMFPSKKRVTG
jgi:hypothetical protein